LVVENVAGDNKRIDLALDHDLAKTLKHLPMFELPRESSQGLSDMPVARVQDTDHSWFPARRQSAFFAIAF